MTTPELTIGMLATAGLGVAGVVAFWRWCFSGPLMPDPWGEQVQAELQSPDSLPVCHRCLHEHAETCHFCPQCGASVGDYNNMLPWEQLFSEGEVLRNGTGANLPRRPWVLVGYVLLSTAAYLLFAPVYWFFLIRNWLRPVPPPLHAPAE